MSDQWEAATRKLIQLTREGQLDWEPDRQIASQRGHDCEVIGVPYVAETGGKRIAVYEYHVPQWDEVGHVVPCTGSNVRIEFVDETGAAEWSWPSPKGRYELLEEIRYRQSEAEQFLNTFLSRMNPG